MKFQALSYTKCQRSQVSAAVLNYSANIFFAINFCSIYSAAKSKKVVIKTQILHSPTLKSVLCMALTSIYFQNAR